MAFQNKTRNILFVTPTIPFPLHTDGGLLYQHMLLKYLSKRGHRIICLCYGRETDPVGPINDYCKLVYVPPVEFRNASVFRKTLENLYVTPRLARIYTNRAMKVKISEILNRYPIDLIHSNSIWLSKNTCDIVGYPKLINAIDADSLYFYRNFKAEKRPIKRLFWLLQFLKVRAFERKIYPLFESCTVVSQKDKIYFSSFLKSLSIYVAPLGVDTEYFSPMAQPEEFPSLVFTGVMDYPPNTKGILYFIREIFPAIKKHYPALTLSIVGINPTRELLEQSSEHIRITGYVEDLRPYIQRASLYVSPIYSGTGVKIKLLQAMAMGKPIIATPLSVEGLPQALHEEHIIIARNKKEFISRTVDLLDNQWLRSSLGHQARRLSVQAFSWDRTTDLFEDIYTKTCETFKKNYS